MIQEKIQEKLSEYEKQKNSLYAQLYYIPEAREILQNIQAITGAIQATKQLIESYQEENNG